MWVVRVDGGIESEKRWHNKKMSNKKRMIQRVATNDGFQKWLFLMNADDEDPKNGFDFVCVFTHIYSLLT